MKYIYTFSLVNAVLMISAQDTPQQLARLQKGCNQLNTYIRTGCYPQFERQFKITFKGEQEEVPRPLFTFSSVFSAFCQKISARASQQLNKETPQAAPINIEEKKEKYLTNIHQRITAEQNYLLHKDDKVIHWKKLKSSFEYFFATLGLIGLGILSHNKTLDQEDCAFLQPLIFEHLFGTTLPLIPLSPCREITATLLGISAVSAYYGAQDLYNGLFFGRLTQQKLKNIKAMQQCVTDYKAT